MFITVTDVFVALSNINFKKTLDICMSPVDSPVILP